ncbi:hypothetical protein XJ18_17910 [Bacillus pumilus]|nr:hypothetical protein XJ18_17910 [Bacillus pumilus]
MSAASDTDKLSALNALSAVLAISAASARFKLPAAARSSAPAKPPFMMSFVDTPAFTSSSVACAVSVALKDVDSPSLIARSVSVFISSAVAPDTALTALICCSKFAAAFADAPMPTTTAPPTAKAAFCTRPICELNDLAELPICCICAWACATPAVNWFDCSVSVAVISPTDTPANRFPPFLRYLKKFRNCSNFSRSNSSRST